MHILHACLLRAGCSQRTVSARRSWGLAGWQRAKPSHLKWEDGRLEAAASFSNCSVKAPVPLPPPLPPLTRLSLPLSVIPGRRRARACLCPRGGITQLRTLRTRSASTTTGACGLCVCVVFGVRCVAGPGQLVEACMLLSQHVVGLVEAGRVSYGA